MGTALAVRSFEAPARGRGGSSSRGGVPIWVPLGLLLVLVAVVGSYLSRDGEDLGVVDTSRFAIRVTGGGTPVLPIWQDRLASILGQEGDVSAHDRGAIEELAERVSQLSFVAEVGQPEVIWPDGVSLPMRFHVPCANVRVGDIYLPVAENGTILSGGSSLPHEIDGYPLPVLGPLDGALDRLRPGDRLVDDRHRDALSVALSLGRELAPSERRDLGRILIDASAPLAVDGQPGGVVLDLEERRRILFGRSPRGYHPGELPAPAKWRHVAAAAATLAGGGDWAVLDARWDEPDYYDQSEAHAAPDR